MAYNEFLLTQLRDVRFWIFLFFCFHLTTIRLPPLEPASTWRQTDGLMVSRNFYEVDPNILFPRVDVAGDKTGIVGCEFPFLNYLIYAVSLLFGFENWYGRLINLCVSSVGVFFLYRLIADYFEKRTALWSCILVLISQWFTYNRTNIPDTFSASLCLISVYYGIKYLESGRMFRLMIFLVLGTLGCLNKISAGCLLTLLAIPFVKNGVSITRKSLLAVSSGILISAVWLWYFYWVPHLNQAYGFGSHFFMGMSFSDGMSDLARLWKESLKRFTVTPFKYTGFALFLSGLFIVIWKKMWYRLIVFLLPFLAYIVVVIKSGYGFQLNPYYVIMFIPPMAFIAASGLSMIPNHLVAVIIIMIVSVEGIGNQIHIFRIRESHRPMTKIESVIDRYSKRTDRIAINGTTDGDPTPMYFAHRKGLTLSNDEFKSPSFKETCKAMDIRYAVILPEMYGNVELDLPKLHEDKFIVIYEVP